jgi:hypothetical protein
MYLGTIVEIMCNPILTLIRFNLSKQWLIFIFAMHQSTKTMKKDTLASPKNVRVDCVPEYLRL